MRFRRAIGVIVVVTGVTVVGWTPGCGGDDADPVTGGDASSPGSDGSAGGDALPGADSATPGPDAGGCTGSVCSDADVDAADAACVGTSVTTKQRTGAPCVFELPFGDAGAFDRERVNVVFRRSQSSTTLRHGECASDPRAWQFVAPGDSAILLCDGVCADVQPGSVVQAVLGCPRR